MNKGKQLLISIVLISLVFGEPCYPHARWGPWLDRDNPGGYGDYEKIILFEAGRVCENPTAVQCRIKTTAEDYFYNTSPQKIVSNTKEGCYCANA